MNKIKLWFLSFSPLTLISAFSSVTLGTALAWYHNGKINWLFYIITLLGILFAQAGINLTHDYREFVYKTDIIYRELGIAHRANPIIDYKLKPLHVKVLGYSLILFALFAGIYLALMVGVSVLIIGIIGIFLGIAYTEPPFKLVYRGLGEIIAGIIMGPLVVWGSFVVQTRSIMPLYPLIVGAINGADTYLILIASSILMLEASKEANKKTLVLKIGLNKTKYAILAGILVMYLSLVISSILNYIPLISLVSLLLLYRTVKIVRPLFSISENEIKNKSNEIKRLWKHPFWFTLIILIIVVASMIITKYLKIM